MSSLTIISITVSCEVADKTYGNGNGRFMSASAKIPDGAEGIALTDTDTVIQDGIEMYFATWQTLMQTRYATGEITGNEYTKQTAAFRLRLERIQGLYRKVKNYSSGELEELLKKIEEKEKANVQGN